MRNGHAQVTEMIRAARTGDSEALDRLLALYRNYLAFLARQGLDTALRLKAAPSDIVQETMLQAFRDFPRFRGRTEAELTAWLRQILAHSITAVVRRFKGTAARDVGRERPIEDVLCDSAVALGNLAQARETTASQAAEQRERSVILADALAALGDDQRRVVMLRDIEQLEWEQVARRMGRTPGAVRMLWMRALKALAPLIERSRP
ncbi:MAG: sigma-70 family RNA polymerase sigma factor [Planctomycetota bacterium]|jgi:RNA polymerase sigma-70 factor (ECF subfamily)